jgi:exopolyphosphatase/guanosine-5'-triphosphate,3'-diphosphate pyrophosphatase
MERLAAAIDIGTYTARLLIGKVTEQPLRVCEIERARQYIRVGEGMDGIEDAVISEPAFERTLAALRSFQDLAGRHGLSRAYAVATGVVRLAKNSDAFLERLQKETGIEIELISGDREARLSALGVETSLSLQGRDVVIFDLGGGSTEFFVRRRGSIWLHSIPVGAMTLTKRFLKEDPPSSRSLAELRVYLDGGFLKSLGDTGQFLPSLRVAGTGGTTVTLACIKKGLRIDQISSVMINGTILKREEIDAISNGLGSMCVRERANLDCLDEARAVVIVAGSLAVSRMLHALQAEEMTVSMSDLLEGMLIERYGGYLNE